MCGRHTIRIRIPPRAVTALALAASVWCAMPSVAGACILNNKGSLSANGTLVENTYATQANGQPAPTTFSFPVVYGRGDTIRFTENLADLQKSLSAVSISRPFLWVWGDGTYSRSRNPSHRYNRVGTYLIRVFALGPAQGDSWTPFDRATIRVVPPGEVWRDNLGHTVLGVFDLAVSWTIWIILSAVALLLAWGFWEEWRHRRRRQRRSAQVGRPA
ncbi:MAG TPA: PKD domain-containing protein [Chloroflexota bacterium]|nr:PKD domain-containing protein [Chloroflexota bacterium]